MSESVTKDQCPLDMSDDDVFAAMKKIGGYIDITPRDFREIYYIAYRHALEQINQSVLAKDIMTTPVIHVQTDTPLTEAADVMAAANISGVPVVNEDRQVVGVISEKDFLREMGGQTATFMGVVAHCLNNHGCMTIALKNKTVRELMSSSPITVKGDTPMAVMAQLLDQKKINRIPIVDEQGRLIGIITRTDFLKRYCSTGI
jgi:CBS domain-containing protein